MTKRARILVAAVIGLVLGAALGWFAGWVARSDNMPFFVALGALAGLWGSLAWARVVRPLVLGAIGLLALALLAVVFTPPRALLQGLSPEAPSAPTATAARVPRADGLTTDQVATLSSLRKVDDYPLYTMRYQRSVAAASAVLVSPRRPKSLHTPPGLAPSSPHWATPRTGSLAATSTGATAPRCCFSHTGRRAATRRSRWWTSRISALAMGRST